MSTKKKPVKTAAPSKTKKPASVKKVGAAKAKKKAASPAMQPRAAAGPAGGVAAGHANILCPTKSRACIKARLFEMIAEEGPTSPPTESKTYPQIGLNADFMRRKANSRFFGSATGPVTPGECNSATSIGEHINAIQSK